MIDTYHRDAMDDLDDAINALVRRGTDTWQREHALAEILLAGSPWQPVDRTYQPDSRADAAYVLGLRARTAIGRTVARILEALYRAMRPV
jgi:hypothetical protein